VVGGTVKVVLGALFHIDVLKPALGLVVHSAKRLAYL
jgi:hypothetical protein